MAIAGKIRQARHRDSLLRYVTEIRRYVTELNSNLLRLEEKIDQLRNGSEISPKIKGASTLREDSFKKEKRRGTRLPDDWSPSPAGRQIAVDCGLDPDVTLIVFRNHWLSKPGKDGSKLNWDRTWHNWCLTDRKAKPNGHANNGHAVPIIDPIRRAEIEDTKRRIRESMRTREDIESEL